MKAYVTTKDYDCIYDGLVLYCRVQATGWSGSGSVWVTRTNNGFSLSRMVSRDPCEICAQSGFQAEDL
jgi:hypothetical protein